MTDFRADNLSTHPLKLLFLCTHNACRSILAESIARKAGGHLWQTTSAGSHPIGTVHPATLRHLREKGYPTDNLFSKSWDDLSGNEPDITITVCDQAAGETCPIWLGNSIKSHWGFPDPTGIDDPGQQSALFNEIIRLLEVRLSELARYVQAHHDLKGIAPCLKQLEALS